MSNEQPATLNVDYEDDGDVKRVTFVLRCPVSEEYTTSVSVTEHVENRHYHVDAWNVMQYSNGSLCITARIQNRQMLTMIVKHAGQDYTVIGSADFELRDYITTSDNIEKRIKQEMWKMKSAKDKAHKVESVSDRVDRALDNPNELDEEALQELCDLVMPRKPRQKRRTRRAFR